MLRYRCSSNKLHSVKPHLGYCSVTHLSRRDAVILRRLRIGHTRVTHKCLLSDDNLNGTLSLIVLICR